MKKIKTKTSISKTDTIKVIEDFFTEIKTKSSEEVRKIKKLAMGHNLPLKEKRKTFCKECLNPYVKSKIRINKKIKSLTCEKCGCTSRWRIKASP